MLKRPPCPMCGGVMRLSRITPVAERRADRRIFECQCGHELTEIVEL